MAIRLRRKTLTIGINGEPDSNKIKNKHDGTLIQKVKTNRKFGNKVFCTKYLSGNDKATVLVYDYMSTPPVTGGTYVVLQFKESGMYFACEWSDCKWNLILQPGTDAKEIKSPADPRVFLKKLAHNSTTDLVYASYVASQQSPEDRSKARVITLLEDINKAAVFRLEGNGPSLESQYFTMDYATQESAEE
ncbi:hypothetical protein Bbelb_334020 [Branchiostoma belcheri]|nr:hypothetical protein Bbelb_334020 [Branchiostoma belcheri]